MAHHFLNIQNSFPPFRKSGKIAFFCHSSYEPRSLASINTTERCHGIESVFIFHFHDFLGSKAYLQNHTKLVQYFASVSSNDPIQIPVESSVQNGLLESYKPTMLEAINHADYIAIDISTFNRGVLIYLLDVILREKGDKPLYLFYSDPEKYATEKCGVSTTWLTNGVKNVLTVPGFLGDKQEQKPSLLILLLGCDAEREISTIEEVNPDKIVVIMQSTLKCRKGLREVYLKNHAMILERYADKITNILSVKPHGWEAVYDVFTRIYALYRNQYNLTALLHGTKMQVVGAVTFCQKHPDVELLYSQPEEYNCNDYTYGMGPTWWLSVPDMNMFKK